MIETLQLGVSILAVALLVAAVAKLSGIKSRLDAIHKEINNWRYHI